MVPRSFQTGEKLYGRDHELRDLLDLLIAERIVLLYSPSGAGKSSLLQAGLIPQLQAEGFHVLPVIRVNQEAPAAVASPNKEASLPRTGSIATSSAPCSPWKKPIQQDQQLPEEQLAGLDLAGYLQTRSSQQDGKDGG